jgi:hypothetical protein
MGVAPFFRVLPPSSLDIIGGRLKICQLYLYCRFAGSVDDEIEIPRGIEA